MKNFEMKHLSSLDGSFYMIKLEKFDEYRDRTSYYFSRIERKKDMIRYIWMMNGMHSNARQMLLEFKGLVITRKTYILRLGRIISTDTQHITSIVYKL